jgi:hypothetical protein
VLLASVPEDDRRRSMHVVAVDGSVASAGDAMIALMAVFPATRRQARVARLWPPRRRQIAEEYWRLANRRSELSERVPDVPPIVVPPVWVRLPDAGD